MNPFRQIAALILAFAAFGCGYAFQNSASPLRDREGIRTVYVAPPLNNSYKPGVEKTIYNDLIRTLVAQRRVTLAASPETADAVLRSTVDRAILQVAGVNTGSNLNGYANLQPQQLAQLSRFNVVTQYMATLTCSFELTRTHTPPGKRGLLWTAKFDRAKPFSAASNLDVIGTTNATINDSEFDRALGDISKQMMADVHESMLAMF